ncbi:hypothetical protein L1887_15315 [Cichorium endivia]|nr:hypothetical protein L1887_15315 [Cichorium endivia]
MINGYDMKTIILKMDGGLSIWGFPVTPIRNQGGAGEPMGRNGGALEMLFPIRNTVKDTSIEAAIVQESLWKAKMAMLSPFPLKRVPSFPPPLHQFPAPEHPPLLSPSPPPPTPNLKPCRTIVLPRTGNTWMGHHQDQ